MISATYLFLVVSIDSKVLHRQLSQTTIGRVLQEIAILIQYTYLGLFYGSPLVQTKNL